MVKDQFTTQYYCEETGVIIDNRIASFSMFITATPYEILYKKHLPIFKKHPLNIYGLPFYDKPQRIYKGTDREGSERFDHHGNFISDDDLKSENDVLKYLGEKINQKKLEILWVRSYGDNTDIPSNYDYYGIDITYEPSVSGAFSIICDCMFICRWHGCDIEGTLFADDFSKLNENGLFSCFDDAYQYMIRYLKQDWTERGQYYIVEVFGRK